MEEKYRQQVKETVRLIVEEARAWDAMARLAYGNLMEPDAADALPQTWRHVNG